MGMLRTYRYELSGSGMARNHRADYRPRSGWLISVVSFRDALCP